MAKINIRKLHANDLSELPALWSKHLMGPGAYEVDLSFTTPDAWAQKVSKRLYIQYIFDRPLSILGLETYVCAVAQVENGEIVGTIVARRMHPFAKTWELADVVVHTNYRRLGIATYMMNFVMNHLKKKKAKLITLTVERGTVAKGLYEKFDFKCSESFFILYRNLRNLSYRIERHPFRRDPKICFKKISGRPFTEDFLSFWFKKIASTILSVFFREFPQAKIFAAIKEGKAIGYVKVDCSKFEKTGIVEEIHLHPEFRGKSFTKEYLKAVAEILQNVGMQEVIFRVIKTSIDRSLLRNILLELNLTVAREFYILLKDL